MRKGDLVRRIRFDTRVPENLVEELRVKWKDPCMVVRGTYEGHISYENRSGQKITEISPVIDVMHLSGVIKGVPVEHFERL